jgi:hypothetical protein
MSETVTDKLTENGIKSNHTDVSMVDYRDLHGEPLVNNDDVVIFRDEYGYELNEWANAFDMDRSSLSARMHELAREHYGDRDGRGPKGGDPWSVSDPVVFDADTFDE